MQAFSCEFWKISENIFSTKHLWAIAHSDFSFEIMIISVVRKTFANDKPKTLLSLV